MDECEQLVLNLKPDICVFVESWLDERTPNSAIDIPGYVAIRRDRNSFGGGILCYFCNKYNVRVLDSPVSLDSYDTEMLCIYVNDLRLLVISIYHPVWNNQFKHDGALSCILEIIDSVLSSDEFPSDSKVILCGDFNDLHKFEKKISNLSGLKSHVVAPTRMDRPLDLIFSNYDTNVTGDILPPLGRSDHAVVFWKPAEICNPSVTKVKVRKYTKSNISYFRDILISTDWLGLVMAESCLDDSASIFLSTLKYLVDLCFPMRCVRIRETDPVWMSSSLRILINDRDAAWRDKKMNKYLRLREEVIREIKRSKSSFLKEAARTHNAKDMWRSIKKIGRYVPSKSTPPFPAQEFGDYFSSTYDSSSDINVLNWLDSLNGLPNAPLEVSEVEVHEVLSKMKKKSPGADGVPSWIFRDFSIFLAPAITYLFNRSFDEGQVPSCFKHALITPVPKVQKPSSPAQYRPISLLPCVSKVLEKLVVRHWLLPYLKNFDVSQFAYVARPGSGTVSALTLMYNRILRYLDSSSGAVRLMTLDFSKAFDKLPFQTILRSCIKLKLPTRAIIWLSSYLTGRWQCVSFQNSASSWFSLPSGVPQGSIIGPLLFSIAVADLVPIHENTSVIKYADDITLLHFMRSVDDDFLQSEFNNVVSWSEAAGLQLNLSKCSIINFVTKKSLHCSPIVCSNGDVLPVKNEVKILGVTFTDNLLWNTHVQNQVKKACKRIFIIRNLKRSGCDEKVIFNVYTALIRSVLLYCYPCFCNAPQYLHDMLLKVEKRVLKIVSKDFVSDCANILNAADNQCSALFKNVLTASEHPLRELFLPRLPTSRNPCNLRRPRIKTKRFSSSFVKFCPT